MKKKKIKKERRTSRDLQKRGAKKGCAKKEKVKVGLVGTWCELSFSFFFFFLCVCYLQPRFLNAAIDLKGIAQNACINPEDHSFGDDYVQDLNFLANNAMNSKLEDELDNWWFEDVSFL